MADKELAEGAKAYADSSAIDSQKAVTYTKREDCEADFTSGGCHAVLPGGTAPSGGNFAPTMAGFLIGALAVNLLPGPDMLYIAGRSLAQGRRAGIVAALGIGAGCFVHILAAGFGLALGYSARSACRFLRSQDMRQSSVPCERGASAPCL